MRRLLFLVLVGAAGFAALVALGVWQLQRHEWKRGILAGIAARMAEPVAALPAEPLEARDEYRAVELAGEMEARELHVLTSRPGRGPGFLVIVPFATPDGRRVLLQRGFVPEAAKAVPRPGGPVTVAGNLLWPDDATAGTPPPDAARAIWFARDVAAMAAALGTEPVLLVARSDTGGGVEPVPAGVNIPDNHLDYAITWFGLAAVWAGMTLLFLRRRRG